MGLSKLKRAPLEDEGRRAAFSFLGICHNMLKKTLIASALTLGLMCATSGVQANPLTNVISGLVNGVGFTDMQFEARRGGARRASPTRSTRASSTRSSSRAVTTTNNNTSSSSANTNRTTNQQQQQDAQFSQNAYRGNTNTNTNANMNNGALGNNNAAMYNRGSMGTGSTFLSSLAGAGAGVLLANMLLSPSAAAAAGTEVATPDMLSDDQIKECLTQLDTDLKDLEAQVLEAPEEEQAALREQISQMHNLQISLMKEQLNRLQSAS